MTNERAIQILENLISINGDIIIGDEGREALEMAVRSLQQEQQEEPELVRHPPIAYTYPSDASRDERLKMALLALLNSDLIKVAGNKFTKQDLIDWVEKQKEQKPEGVQGDKGDPGLPGIEAVEGVVHHVMNAHYIVTNQKQLNARLREIPEGTKVNIFICKAKEEGK